MAWPELRSCCAVRPRALLLALLPLVVLLLRHVLQALAAHRVLRRLTLHHGVHLHTRSVQFVRDSESLLPPSRALDCIHPMGYMGYMGYMLSKRAQGGKGMSSAWCGEAVLLENPQS